ncbi:MAG TPA: FHA domain-containing protein [Terracidiphilus sp.]|nr:FHA domain-containing protein [Terracidiphilus sp.]
MEIEIEVIGKPNRWVVNQSPIRIGRGSSCEIALPARQFPTVGVVHAQLEVVNGALRVGAHDPGNGELYLNDQPVDSGAYILSGDVLRLGQQGPLLRVSFAELAVPRVSHDPTRVMQVGEVSAREIGRESTRVMLSGDLSGRQPTQVMNVPAPPSEPAQRQAPPLSSRAPQSSGFGDGRGQIPPRPVTTPVPSPVMTPVARAASSVPATVDTRGLEKSLRMMQILQGVSLVVIVVLAVLLIRLESQVSANQDALHSLQAQNANAVSQFTPALDARLTLMGQRMDALDGTLKADEERMERGMDAKMKAAQDELFANLDSRMRSTEDHMVNRMNTELPPLLDKYVNAKMAQFKQ